MHAVPEALSTVVPSDFFSLYLPPSPAPLSGSASGLQGPLCRSLSRADPGLAVSLLSGLLLSQGTSVLLASSAPHHLPPILGLTLPRDSAGQRWQPETMVSSWRATYRTNHTRCQHQTASGTGAPGCARAPGCRGPCGGRGRRGQGVLPGRVACFPIASTCIGLLPWTLEALVL